MKQIKDSEGNLLMVDDCDEYRIRIGWQVDDGEIYCYIGDSPHPKVAPTNPDEWLNWIACEVATADKAADKDRDGYFWESLKSARAALAAISLAVQSGKPWPEWAVKAKASGWKAPKGWAP